MSELTRPARFQWFFAFAAVYLIWGSTYLAIRFAIETLPGWSMAGVRFLLAGGVLYAWARLRGARALTRGQWRNAWLIGTLLLLGGNGLVVWAEHYVPSGWAALIVGTEPIWVTIFLLLGAGRERPRARTLVAIATGFVGVAVLTAPGTVSGSSLYLPGLIALLIAPASWAAGSLLARDADLPRSAALATASQMLTGGAALLATGTVLGEWRAFDPSAVSVGSWLAFAYLVVFGSLIAFSAYAWLVRNAEPTLAATYAYVNPVVAVFLGGLLAGEPLGIRTFVACGLIIGAVVLLSVRRRARIPPRPVPIRRSDPAEEGPAGEVPADEVLDRCA